jgi:hypothetical protein
MMLPVRDPSMRVIVCPNCKFLSVRIAPILHQRIQIADLGQMSPLFDESDFDPGFYRDNTKIATTMEARHADAYRY